MVTTDPSSRPVSHNGFTLIELLSAMGIMVLIVMLLASAYNESVRVWNTGRKRVLAAAEGRVVMDFLVRDFSMALADDVLTFKLVNDGPVKVYDADADELYFVAAVRPGESGRFKRTANAFIYYVTNMVDEDDKTLPNRYRLVRQRRTEAMFSSARRGENAYNDREWWRDVKLDESYVETVAENVAGFEVWAYSEKAGDYRFDYYSPDENDELPLWVDIYLEVLGEDEGIQAAILWTADQNRAKEFINQRVLRYTARVYFQNRERAQALTH